MEFVALVSGLVPSWKKSARKIAPSAEHENLRSGVYLTDGCPMREDSVTLVVISSRRKAFAINTKDMNEAMGFLKQEAVLA